MKKAFLFFCFISFAVLSRAAGVTLGAAWVSLTSTTSATAFTYAYTTTSNSNRCLILVARRSQGAGGPGTVSSASFNGTSMSNEIPSFTQNFSSGGQSTSLWYINNVIASTTANIIVVYNVAEANTALSAAEYDGVDPFTPFGTAITWTASTGSSYPITVTTQYANSAILDTFMVHWTTTSGSISLDSQLTSRISNIGFSTSLASLGDLLNDGPIGNYPFTDSSSGGTGGVEAVTRMDLELVPVQPTATPTWTPTFTITLTSTPTPTATPSWTPTITSTSTWTPTVTPTFTFTSSPTPTNTPTITPTPTTVLFNGVVHSICVDGESLYVGGTFSMVNGITRNNAAAVDRYTGNVLPWNPNPNSDVLAITATAGGVFLGGTFTGLTPGATDIFTNSNGLVEVDPVNGVVIPYDAYLGPDSYGSPAGVRALLLAQNNLYVAGSFNDVSTDTVALTERFSGAAFTLTTTAASPALCPWNPGPYWANDIEPVKSMVLGPLGTIFLGGSFQSLGYPSFTYPRQCLAEVDAVNGLPTAWRPWVGGDPHTVDQIKAIYIYNGAIYVGGSFNSVGMGSFLRSNLAGISPVTSQFLSWNPVTDNTVNAITSSEGALDVGGSFLHFAGYTRQGLGAVMSSNGNLATPNATATDTITPTPTNTP